MSGSYILQNRGHRIYAAQVSPGEQTVWLGSGWGEEPALSPPGEGMMIGPSELPGQCSLREELSMRTREQEKV